MPLALAVDVGGTKMAAAVVDDQARIRSRAVVPTGQAALPADGSAAERLYETVLTCVIAALRGADVRPDELDGVGVGCGGPMRWPEGAVSPLSIPAWRDFPLRQRLAEELGAEPVLVHNDAVAIAVGEHWRGAGRGTANLLGVTVSTGVGGGLVLGGVVHHGASGNGGHIGHIVVEPDGPRCACGGSGCLEAVASGPNTVRWALEQGWRPAQGSQADGAELAAAAAGGDPRAAAALGRSGGAVGQALASAACVLDLEVVAVVGGVTRSGAAFWEPLLAAYSRHARIGFVRQCRVGPSALGADAGLVGAAAFVLVRERYGWAVERGRGPQAH